MDFLSNFQNIFLATLQPGDYVGFTFFIGTMAMMAASVFFFLKCGMSMENGRPLCWFPV